MRVLHITQPLTSPGPWFAFARTTGHCAGEGSLLALADVVHASALSNPEETHMVAVLGATRTRHLCTHLPLRGSALVSPPLGQPYRAAPGMRRLLHRTGPLDAVVCWGTNLRRLARRIAYAAPHWLEVDMHSGDASPFHPGRTGVQAPVASVLPDGQFASSTTRTRASARRLLGLAENERAVALLSDDACPASATQLLGAAAMLQTAGVSATYIIPTSCKELTRAARRVREGTYARRVILSDLPSTLAARSADISVCCPGDVEALARHASLAYLAREAVRHGAHVVAPDAWVSAWQGNTTPLPTLVSAKGATPTDIARAMLRLMTATEHHAPSHAAATPHTPPASQRNENTLLAALRALAHAPAPH